MKRNLACLGICGADRLIPNGGFRAQFTLVPSARRKGVRTGEVGSDSPSSTETNVLVRALLMAVVALSLSGCMDSERLRGDSGTPEAERAQRTPGR